MILVEIDGVSINLKTDESLFSAGGLDRGTKAMLSCVQFSKEDKVLDLGCGYGVVGIYAAKLTDGNGENITMVDIDETAVALSKENATLNEVSGINIVQSDGFRNLDETGYTIILSNPPYHTDFSVAKHFIEKGFNRLAMGGRFIMVTKRREWYKNKFIAVFGGVIIKEIDGYFIFTAEKRSKSYANKKAK